MSTPVAKQYIKNFEKLGFGMFVHFGLYSIIGEGEWVGKMDTSRFRFTREEYVRLMDVFNPDSMRNMVASAKKAGCRYITITTRHHDGFSLYDTCGLTDYDAPHALCGRDLIRE